MLLTGWLAGCNQNKEPADSLLLQPPFKPITDSIRQQPDNAELYYKRATLLVQSDQLNYAETDLRKAWSLQHNEQFALGLINILARKSPDSALAFIQEALKFIPQSIGLQISLARGYQQKNQIEKALAVCNQILTFYPNQLDALELKAELLQQENKNAEALLVLEKAYTYAPFDAGLAYKLAFEYAQAKNPKALSLSDSLIKMDVRGKHAEPYYFKAVYYSNTGKQQTALSFFNQAIQHDYYFLDAYMEKGRLLFYQKNYAKALQTFQLAITVSPTFADAYFWQGKVQQAMGKKEEARLNYQRAYSLDKTLTEAKQAMDDM
jgi:tetratricopeptide (TPR) repeat protein